jgi:O-methyltransferase
MKSGLEFFYPRLTPGGFLVLHDYSSLEWDGAEKAIDEFLADKPERVIPIPDKSGTVVLRKIRGVDS